MFEVYVQNHIPFIFCIVFLELDFGLIFGGYHLKDNFSHRDITLYAYVCADKGHAFIFFTVPDLDKGYLLFPPPNIKFVQ